MAEAHNGVAAAAPLLHVEYMAVANDPPVANDDSANTDEDTATSIDVAANDSDPNGNLDPATPTRFVPPAVRQQTAPWSTTGMAPSTTRRTRTTTAATALFTKSVMCVQYVIRQP